MSSERSKATGTFPGQLDSSLARALLTRAASVSLPSLAAPPFPLGSLPNTLFADAPWAAASERLTSQLDKLMARSEHHAPTPARKAMIPVAPPAHPPARKINTAIPGSRDGRETSSVAPEAGAGAWPVLPAVSTAQHGPLDVEGIRRILKRHAMQLPSASAAPALHSLQTELVGQKASLVALADATTPTSLPSQSQGATREPIATPLATAHASSVAPPCRDVFGAVTQRPPAQPIAAADASLRPLLLRLVRERRAAPAGRHPGQDPGVAHAPELELQTANSLAALQRTTADDARVVASDATPERLGAALRRATTPDARGAAHSYSQSDELRAAAGASAANVSAAETPTHGSRRGSGALQQLLDQWPASETVASSKFAAPIANHRNLAALSANHRNLGANAEAAGNSASTPFPHTSFAERPLMTAADAIVTPAALASQLPGSSFGTAVAQPRMLDNLQQGPAASSSFADLLDDLLLREARRHGLGREDT